MKFRSAIHPLAVMVLALASAGVVIAAPPAHDHDHGGAVAAKALPAGERWPTDEALRRGMDGVRAAIEPKLARVHSNKATAADYREIATKVEAQVAYIVANCKLPPDADAALHVPIGKMLEGADAMAGRSQAKPRDGAIKVVAALEQYAREFDHPGWKPLPH